MPTTVKSRSGFCPAFSTINHNNRSAVEAIFNVVLPVFAIIAAGYGVARIGLLGEASSEALNGFVYYIALPALFFLAMAQTPFARIFDWPFLGAFLGATFAIFLLTMALAALLFPGRLGQTTLHGLSAAFPNTGYIGIPLFIAAFGTDGAFPVVLTNVVQSVTIFVAAIILMEIDRSWGRGAGRLIGDVVRGIALNPFVIASTAGLLVNASGIGLAQPVETFFSLVGAAAAPCALFALGLFMVGKPITTGLGEVAWVNLFKLVAYPALAWVAGSQVFGLPPDQTAKLVLICALPTGALVFVLAQKYGIYIQRSSAIILISTVLSVATISALLAF